MLITHNYHYNFMIIKKLPNRVVHTSYQFPKLIKKQGDEKQSTNLKQGKANYPASEPGPFK